MWFCLFFFFVFFSFNSESKIQGQEGQPAVFIQGNNRFAFDLYHKLKDPGKNLFFSPYSISSALAMTYVGAKSKTRQDMQSVLHFTENAIGKDFASMSEALVNESRGKGSTLVFDLANSVWLDQNEQLLPDYQSILSGDFQSAIQTVDFMQSPQVARKEINSWVSDKTHQKILDILSEKDISAATRLILISAIYFKASWHHPFDPERTDFAPFYVQKNKSINVPMMESTYRYPYFKGEGFSVLELAYENEKDVSSSIRMLLVLPDAIDGLENLERELTNERFSSWMLNLKSQYVSLFLPKFKLESTIDLGNALQSMGMEVAFSHEADFSGINGKKNLQIDKMIHKAFLSVDEAGAEAAAASAVLVALKSLAIKEPVIFRADHPFLFFIMDNQTQSILFLGKLAVPEEVVSSNQ